MDPILTILIVVATTLLSALAIAAAVLLYLHTARSRHEEYKEPFLSSTLKLSKEQTAALICQVPSKKQINQHAMKGSTSAVDFRRHKYAIDGKLIDNSSIEPQLTKFSRILEGQMTEKTLTEDIVKLMHKHKDILVSAHKVNDAQCELLSDRIGMVAIFEDMFKKHSGITPNPTLLHNIVTHINQSGPGGSAHWFFLGNHFVEGQILGPFTEHSSVSDVITSFTPINEDKIMCRTSMNIELYDKETSKKYGVNYALNYTISSKSADHFSYTLYENVTIDLTMPKAMGHHCTNLGPVSRTARNMDEVILTTKKKTGGKILFTYSVPSLVVPSIISKDSLALLEPEMENAKTDQVFAEQKKQR